MVESGGRVRAALVLLLMGLILMAPVSAGAVVLQSTDGSVTYGVTEEAAIEYAFRELVNGERTAAGLAPLASFDDLIDDARTQADDMSAAGYLYHNPDLAEVTASENWLKLGENVGYGPTVDVLHEAFMDSAPHAANVLKDVYNYVGVGATVDESGTIWVAIVFMYGPDGLAGATDQGPETYTMPFSDDDGSTHESAIAAIAAADVTAGCDPTGRLYCPDREVTRGQMASFLVRALDLAATEIDYFADDEDSAHEDAINRLAASGITNGCGADSFCPDRAISRQHMATFLVRALDLPTAGTDYFVDDADSAHEGAINSLAAAGVTGGCGDDSYCPLDNVTRAQMATFLARALGLV